jgi:hypothetical protein
MRPAERKTTGGLSSDQVKIYIYIKQGKISQLLAMQQKGNFLQIHFECTWVCAIMYVHMTALYQGSY